MEKLAGRFTERQTPPNGLGNVSHRENIMLHYRVLCLAALASVAIRCWTGQAGNQAPPPVPQQEVVVPTTPVPPPTVVRPLTLAEFAESFKPAPGTYEVVLLHPDTCCPVKVCFTLPCGCPK